MTSSPATLVLATRDTVFAAVCERALAGGEGFDFLVAVSTVDLLDVARQREPDVILLDVDGQDAAAIKVLASKLALVTDARIILASAYLAPGSPGLCGLLQSIAGSSVVKPGGASSLGLASGDGAAFVASLSAAVEGLSTGESP